MADASGLLAGDRDLIPRCRWLLDKYGDDAVLVVNVKTAHDARLRPIGTKPRNEGCGLWTVECSARAALKLLTGDPA